MTEAGSVARRALDAGLIQTDADYYLGELQAQRYFFQWDLPGTRQDLARLAALDRTPYDMKDEWFQ